MAFVSLAAIAAFLTIGATPLASKAGLRLGLWDKPGQGKIHQRAVARAGGWAVFLGQTGALFGLGFFLYPALLARLSLIMLPSALLFLVGSADDVWQIHPRLKLFLTVLIGLVFCLIFPYAFSGFWTVVGGYGLLVLWTAYLTNAVNLLDGLDGLAAGSGAISLFFLALLAWWLGRLDLVLLATAGFGASLGFLLFNWHPARIFLGDGGSYFLGGLLVTVTVGLLGGISYRIMPILIILALPAADSATVLSCRILAKKSLIFGDLDHTYNRLLKKVGLYRKTVLILYGFGCLAGLIGTAMYFQNWWTNLLIFVTVVVLALILLDRLDYFKKGEP